MKPKWRTKEENVRKALQEELGKSLPKKDVVLTGADKPYEFDMVSLDGTIVAETKTYTVGKSYPKRYPYAKVAHTSEACLFLLHAKDAKKRLLVLTDRDFYKLYVGTRQGQMVQTQGVEIRPGPLSHGISGCS